MIDAFRKIYESLTAAQRRGTIVLLAFMLFSMALETLGIGVVFPIVALFMQDDIVARYPSLSPVFEWLGNPGQHTLIVSALLAFVALTAAKSLFLAYVGAWQMRFTSGMQLELSQRLFAIYLRQPYTFHLQRNSAQLVHNIQAKVGAFRGALGSAMTIVAESLVVLGISIILLVVEPVALIVLLILSCAAWGVQRCTRKPISRWGKLRQYHAEHSGKHLMQGLGGAKDVKLLGREEDFLAQYRLHSTQLTRLDRQNQLLRELTTRAVEVIGMAGLCTFVLIMLYLGRNTAEIVPTVGLFAAATFRLMPSVNRILGAVQSVRFNLPAIDIVRAELELAAPEPGPRSSRAASFKTEIRLTDVSYAYPGGACSALNSVSIKIRKGESVGLVGPSGSGKSTLVDVILGLLTPNDGIVRVDGRDIQQDLRAWQDQIGYVPQFIYLTDDTLRRNVAFGLPDDQIDDGAVNRAIHAAQLAEFVAGLPDGVNTLLGERGIRLSGGERQRVGIARALYHDPPVLAFDEATSALDLAGERRVMETIVGLQGLKTLLIVAHRLSTVQHCDRLYRLEHGRISTISSLELPSISAI